MDKETRELVAILKYEGCHKVWGVHRQIQSKHAEMMIESAQTMTRQAEEIIEAQTLMADLFHAVNHKRDVWKTASAMQKVSASDDLNVAMANIEISKSYQSHRAARQQKETHHE